MTESPLPRGSRFCFQKKLDALSDDELISKLFSRPGWHALDTYDEKGGIAAFHNVLGIESVTRI